VFLALTIRRRVLLQVRQYKYAALKSSTKCYAGSTIGRYAAQTTSAFAAMPVSRSKVPSFLAAVSSQTLPAQPDVAVTEL